MLRELYSKGGGVEFAGSSVRNNERVIENIQFKAGLIKFAQESCALSGITNMDEVNKMVDKLDKFLKLEELTKENICEFNEWGSWDDEGRLTPGTIEVFNETGNYFFTIDYFYNDKVKGSARTSRAIWLWKMVHQENYDLSRGFLCEWYHQSLSYE